jgi:hypothetical protein
MQKVFSGCFDGPEMISFEVWSLGLSSFQPIWSYSQVLMVTPVVLANQQVGPCQ